MRSFVILLILIGAISLVFAGLSNVTGKASLRPLHIKHISSTEMLKVTYTKKGNGVFINWIDVELSQTEIERIVSWINSVPESEMRKVNQIPPNSSISAGISFKLKMNTELLIQYDLEKIYVTTTDFFNRQAIFSIHQGDLEGFFDAQLKGFYFGEDKVKES